MKTDDLREALKEVTATGFRRDTWVFGEQEGVFSVATDDVYDNYRAYYHNVVGLQWAARPDEHTGLLDPALKPEDIDLEILLPRAVRHLKDGWNVVFKFRDIYRSETDTHRVGWLVAAELF